MRLRLLLLPLAACLLGACAGERRLNPPMVMSDREQEYVDTWAVRSAMDANVAQGVIAEQAVYPFQFEGQSADLTATGKHDILLLADYYKKHPEALMLVRGEATDELYQQRTASVRKALQDAGADPAQITLLDGRPAGEGVTSQDILEGHKADRQGDSQAPSGTSAGTTAGGMGGAPAGGSQ